MGRAPTAADTRPRPAARLTGASHVSPGAAATPPARLSAREARRRQRAAAFPGRLVAFAVGAFLGVARRGHYTRQAA